MKLSRLNSTCFFENLISAFSSLFIQGYVDMAIQGGAALGKICAAKALDEHHTHICISALCRRGASVKWEKGYPVVFHLCHDPQLSGL